MKKRVASAVAREVAAESGSSEIKLPTGGNPLSLTIGPPTKKERVQFSHEDFDELQDVAGLSANQVLKGKVLI